MSFEIDAPTRVEGDTLVLEQQVKGDDGKLTGERNEVRIDARPSDCFVIALKNNADIHVTREVFDQVEDVASQPQQFLAFGSMLQAMAGDSVEIPDGLGDELDKVMDEDDDGGEEDED